MIHKAAIQFKEKNIIFNIIICDECHCLKTLTARRTRTCLPLLHESKRALLLSGTPALSRPIELFPQLHAIDKNTWNDKSKFGSRYCKSKKGDGRSQYKGFLFLNYFLN